MKEITIVVVDDHPLFRQGVINTLSLEPGIKIVGQASNGAEALTMIRSLQPHIAVVDINLPGNLHFTQVLYGGSHASSCLCTQTWMGKVIQ